MSATSAGLATPPPHSGASPRRRWAAHAAWLSPHSNGFKPAQAACIVGLLFAGVSVYWGLGGTWLLATVAGSLEGQGRAGNTSVMLALWVAVVLKVVAAVLPLLALRRLTSPTWNRILWVLAWLGAGVLTIYGLVLTAVGLLVEANVLHASADADHRALAWHAFLWDPWFLVWGLLVVAALLRGRHRLSPAPTGG